VAVETEGGRAVDHHRGCHAGLRNHQRCVGVCVSCMCRVCVAWWSLIEPNMGGGSAGIVISVAFSMVLVIYRSSRPHIDILGRLPGSTTYRYVRPQPSRPGRSICAALHDRRPADVSARGGNSYINYPVSGM
jgi:hypothetical protein